jgi:AraC-like DNA-binding protein
VVVLFDADTVPRADRIETWRAAMVDAVLPMNLFIPDTDRLSARVEAWHLGELKLVRAESSVGMSMALTTRQAKARDEPLFSVGLALCEGGRYEQFGEQLELPGGALHCVDLSIPFEYGRDVGGPSMSLTCLTADQLGLPIDAVRYAAVRLHTSSLYPLVRQHARSLAVAPSLAGDPAAGELGAATIELVRALLASVSRDVRRGRDVLADTMMTRVRTYVRLNLRDPELRPARIAAAHNVSVRYLFRICQESGFSIEQWIITQRLLGARDELRSAASRGRSIEAIARGWGFADPAHFSRRFRDRFDMTPRDWRRATATAQTTDEAF